MATMSNREAMQQIMKSMMTVSDVYRQFIPSQKGESLDEQIYPWNMDGLKQDMEGKETPDRGRCYSCSGNWRRNRTYERKWWGTGCRQNDPERGYYELWLTRGLGDWGTWRRGDLCGSMGVWGCGRI